MAINHICCLATSPTQILLAPGTWYPPWGKWSPGTLAQQCLRVTNNGSREGSTWITEWWLQDFKVGCGPHTSHIQKTFPKCAKKEPHISRSIMSLSTFLSRLMSSLETVVRKKPSERFRPRTMDKVSMDTPYTLRDVRKSTLMESICDIRKHCDAHSWSPVEKTEESVKLGPINSKIVLLDPLYKSIQCKLHGSSTCP